MKIFTKISNFWAAELLCTSWVVNVGSPMWTQVSSHDDPKPPKKLIMFMMMMMLLLMVMMMMMTNKLLLVMMPCPDYTSSWTGAHLQALTYFLPFTSFWWWRRWWWIDNIIMTTMMMMTMRNACFSCWEIEMHGWSETLSYHNDNYDDDGNGKL